MLRFSTLKLRGEKVKGRESKIEFVFNDAFIKEGSLVQVVDAKGCCKDGIIVNVGAGAVEIMYWNGKPAYLTVTTEHILNGKVKLGEYKEATFYKNVIIPSAGYRDGNFIVVEFMDGMEVRGVIQSVERDGIVVLELANTAPMRRKGSLFDNSRFTTITWEKLGSAKAVRTI